MDGGSYSGTSTASLTINTEVGFDGNEYCVVITHLENVCYTETQCAVLTVVDVVMLPPGVVHT